MSTSTFELYVFSHKIKNYEWANLLLLTDEIRHSGYMLVETVTTIGSKGEPLTSYKVSIADVGNGSVGALAMPEDGRYEAQNGKIEGGLFFLKGKKVPLKYAQTQVIFGADAEKNSENAKRVFEKIVINAKLLNGLAETGNDYIPYETFSNNCNSWTTYVMKRLLKGTICDWSHIGWNEGADDLSSLNPLNKESPAVAKILDVFNDTIGSFDCPVPSNPHWDETQLAAGIFDLRFGLEGRDHIITNERNLTLEKTVRREDESEEAFQERANKEVVLSLVADNYHFINKRNKVNVFTGTNEGKIANSGDNCFLATGTGADHILNTGNKVEIYSGSGDDLIINRGSGVTICGGEGADRIFDASEGASTITLGKYVEKDENGQPKNNGTDNDKDILILRKPANSSTNVTGASAEDILALYGGNAEPVFSISGGNIVITLGDGSTVTIENGVNEGPDKIFVNGQSYTRNTDEDNNQRPYIPSSGAEPPPEAVTELLNKADAILSKIALSENSVPVLIDPLVLDMDGDGIEIVGASSSNAYFDLTGNGFATRNDWLGGDDTLSGGAGQIGRIAA